MTGHSGQGRNRRITMGSEFLSEQKPFTALIDHFTSNMPRQAQISTYKTELLTQSIRQHALPAASAVVSCIGKLFPIETLKFYHFSTKKSTTNSQIAATAA